MALLPADDALEPAVRTCGADEEASVLAPALAPAPATLGLGKYRSGPELVSLVKGLGAAVDEGARNASEATRSAPDKADDEEAFSRIKRAAAVSYSSLSHNAATNSFSDCSNVAPTTPAT